MNTPDPVEQAELAERQRASVEANTQFHDPDGDTWERFASGGKRDREKDREVRAAMRAEENGEYDPATSRPPASGVHAGGDRIFPPTTVGRSG